MGKEGEVVLIMEALVENMGKVSCVNLSSTKFLSSSSSVYQLEKLPVTGISVLMWSRGP